MTDYLADAFPKLAGRLRKLPLADLPTPVAEHAVEVGGRSRMLNIKCDNLTSSYYGGNKLRKLEYLLQRAIDKHARRVATFGTVASHHALATTLYARQFDLGCTCLLSHQAKTQSAATVLRLLLDNDAELVRYGGDYHTRVATMREYVQGRRSWVIPIGGSSWLGTVGYVNAGLELAAQIESGCLPAPRRIYIAAGTMGSAAGLALGLALAGADSQIEAIRVSPDNIMNEARLQRLVEKTAAMLSRLDERIPRDLARRTRITVRHEFFGKGYAKSDAGTDAAIEFARDNLQLELEPTYTGKAMAALLHDIRNGADAGEPLLFWNTYNSNALPTGPRDGTDFERLPPEFRRYFD